MGSRAIGAALVLGRELRSRGVVCEVDARGNSLKSMLRRADGMQARWCVVLGDAELDKGVVQVKDLAEHSQQELARGAVADTIASALEGRA
jgi:histidyl-tRNA synthetase